MIKPADLPDTIPVFPLPGALLLPRAKLPLHIFEPRYLQMLEDALKTPERVIGMIQPNGKRNGEGSGLQTIGCAGRVTQFSETEDGRYFITLCGLSRFRVKTEVEGFTPYRRCAVDWAGFDADLGQTECDEVFDRAALMGLLGRYLDARGLSTEPEDKQALLEAPSLSTRRETLVTLMEFALRGGSGGSLEEKLQ